MKSLPRHFRILIQFYNPEWHKKIKSLNILTARDVFYVFFMLLFVHNVIIYNIVFPQYNTIMIFKYINKIFSALSGVHIQLCKLFLCKIIQADNVIMSEMSGGSWWWIFVRERERERDRQVLEQFIVHIMTDLIKTRTDAISFFF